MSDSLDNDWSTVEKSSFSVDFYRINYIYIVKKMETVYLPYEVTADW